MKVNVVFKDKSDKHIIESLGGKVLDALNGLPTICTVDIPEDRLDALRDSPFILYAEKDRSIPFEINHSVNYAKEPELGYHLELMRAKDYWDRGLTGKGAKIAILDSGVIKHYSVTPAGGYDAGDQLDWYTDDEVGVVPHGTHVMSLVVGQLRTVSGIVYGGVAPDASAYAVKMRYGDDPNSTHESTYLRALNWIIENEIDFVNFSISHTSTPILNIAWDTMLSKDIVLIQSIGNTNADVSENGAYPLSDPRNVVVSGIDRNYKRWSSSSWGKQVVFTGPSANVPMYSGTTRTDLWYNGGITGSGTSYSTPLITGVFCLYKQAYPNKTNKELVSLLIDSCKKIAPNYTWSAQFGHGLPQPNEEILAMPIVNKASKALKFDGSGQYIDCGNSPSLNLQNNLTIFSKFNQDVRATGNLFAKGNANGSKIYYGMRLGSDLLTIQYVTAGVQKTVTYEASLADGRDHTLALVFQFPNVRLYIDGKLVPKALSITSMDLSSTEDRLYLGNSMGTTGAYAGIIHNFEIYNYAFTEKNVADKLGGWDNAAGRVLHYQFDGKEKTVINDLSGNGNHGIIDGAAPSNASTVGVGSNRKTFSPPPIANLSHTVTDHSITLLWNATTGFKYEVTREGFFAPLTVATTGTATHARLLADTPYAYEIVAIDPLGHRSAPVKTGVIRTLKDITLPPILTNLRVVDASYNGLVISWNPSTATDVLDFGYYEVRKGLAGSTFDQAEVVKTNIMIAMNTLGVPNLAMDTEYTVWVRAFDGNGNASPPQAVNGRTTNVVPQVFFQDDFNRPDASELGAPWQLQTATTTYGIRNGKATGFGPNSLSSAFVTVDNPNFSVELTIEEFNQIGYRRLLFPRYADNLNFFAIQVVGAQHNIQIAKLKAGSFKMLTTQNNLTTDYGIGETGLFLKAGDRFKVECTSIGLFKCYVNDELILSFVDTDFLSPTTKVGFGSQSAEDRFDNFIVKVLPTP